MQPIAQAIADEVRVERLRRRKTQEEAGAIIGVSQESYARREGCKVVFTGPELLLLAEAYGIDVAEFFPDSIVPDSRAVA